MSGKCYHAILFYLAPAFFWFFGLAYFILPLIGTTLDFLCLVGASLGLGIITGLCYKKAERLNRT